MYVGDIAGTYILHIYIYRSILTLIIDITLIINITLGQEMN